MSAKIVEENGRTTLQIDMYEAIHDALKASERKDLIESLACAEDVIQHVMDQVLEGCTESGYSGCSSVSMNYALQKARLRIAKDSSYAVKSTIEDLERKVKDLEESVQWYLNNWAPRRDY